MIQAMRVIQTVQEMRVVRSELPGRIGLVPTMGALHAGHEALLARAREECETVIASLFVNPAQFGPSEDYSAYPRNRTRDLEIFEACGTDLLFEPLLEEMYPAGESTRVDPGPIADVLEGTHRPGHFSGVATVVAKLFNIIAPDAAYFGRKDAQQLAIVERLVRDLRMDIETVRVETVRDLDGLALSSRNANLADEPRKAAAALFRALTAGEVAWANGERSGDELRTAMLSVLSREPLIEVEYVSAADPVTFEELDVVDGPALLSLAVRVGGTRLIDNIALPDRRGF